MRIKKRNESERADQLKIFELETIPGDADLTELIGKIRILEKRVFIFDSSAGDKKAFQNSIITYLKGQGHETLTKTLWNATYIINKEGRHSKYLYFNERFQRLHLNNSFFEWATLTCKVLTKHLNLNGII